MSYIWKGQWVAQSRMQLNRARICVCYKQLKRVIERKESEWGRRVLLHKTPWPRHHSQCDFILLQLEHGDERGVVHSYCCGSVHRHNLITAPGGNHTPLTWRVRVMKGCRSSFRHVGVKLGSTYLRRPSKWAGVPGTMVLMKKGCWPWLSS